MPDDAMTGQEGVEAKAATEDAKVETTVTETPGNGGEAPAGDGKANTGGQTPDVRDAYKLDTAVDEPKETPGDAPKEGGTQPQDEYKIEWPEGVEATPEFAALTTTAAKAAGLDGKAAGKYTAAVLDALNQAELDNIAKTDAELKQEWGGDYQSNMQACKAFLSRHAKASGLTQEDVAVLQSPKGFKLLYSFMSKTGEQAAHGTEPKAATAADKSWAHSVMHDPGHADYKAFHDYQDPRYGEVHARYNKAVYGV